MNTLTFTFDPSTSLDRVLKVTLSLVVHSISVVHDPINSRKGCPKAVEHSMQGLEQIVIFLEFKGEGATMAQALLVRSGPVNGE